jgi:hypothetical protein
LASYRPPFAVVKTRLPSGLKYWPHIGHRLLAEENRFHDTSHGGGLVIHLFLTLSRGPQLAALSWIDYQAIGPW